MTKINVSSLLIMCALFAGCGEAKRTVNCAQICEKYDECVRDVNVASCTTECEDQADANENYETAAKTCEDCLDNKTCMEATSCWAQCPVVPNT